jgi:hypothetical protein
VALRLLLLVAYAAINMNQTRNILLETTILFDGKNNNNNNKHCYEYYFRA